VLAKLNRKCREYSGESRWIGIRGLLADSEDRASREISNAVQDHGIGIDRSENASHFRGPFIAAPQSLPLQIHGAGLGLSLAKNIAEAMGGSYP